MEEQVGASMVDKTPSPLTLPQGMWHAPFPLSLPYLPSPCPHPPPTPPTPLSPLPSLRVSLDCRRVPAARASPLAWWASRLSPEAASASAAGEGASLVWSVALGACWVLGGPQAPCLAWTNCRWVVIVWWGRGAVASLVWSEVQGACWVPGTMPLFFYTPPHTSLPTLPVAEDAFHVGPLGCGIRRARRRRAES